MGCKASTLLSVKDGAKVSRSQGPNQENSSGVSYKVSGISAIHRGKKDAMASVKAGFGKIHSKFSGVKTLTPSTSPGSSPRKRPIASVPAENISIGSQAIDDADQAGCGALEEIKSHALFRNPPQPARQHAGDLELHTGDEGIRMTTLDLPVESQLEEEPSKRQLKAVWFLMKINAANDSATKIKWMHDLEWLLVSLDPLERKQPTRSVLVEAKALELCVENIKRTPEDLPLCVSCLAILVHLSLAKEASSRLMNLEGIEIITAMLKRYFQNCKMLIALLRHPSTSQQPELTLECGDSSPTVSISERVEELPGAKHAVPLQTANMIVSGVCQSEQECAAVHEEQMPDPKNEATPQSNEADNEASAATLESATSSALETSKIQTCEPSLDADSKTPGLPSSAVTVPQGAVFKRVVSYLKVGKKRTSCEEETPSSAQQEQWTRDLKLTIEFITLVWRLIFATSLDGDVFAQRWVSAGAADVALEAVATKEPLLNDASFVCWSLGALRFMPLANSNLSQSLVVQKGLLKFVIDKMEDHLSDPLVLENGFAVLANFQRRQPTNAVHFHKQCPKAWANAVSWLDREESVMKLDVLFQGLFALGLACSYCPDAAVSVKASGGLSLAERVMNAYSESTRDRSTSSSTDSKIVTLQQFAEGLKVLLMKLVEEECTHEDVANEVGKVTTEPVNDFPSGEQGNAPADHESAQSPHEAVGPNPQKTCTTTAVGGATAEENSAETSDIREAAPKKQEATAHPADQSENCLNMERSESPEASNHEEESRANSGGQNTITEAPVTDTACKVTDDTTNLRTREADAVLVPGDEESKAGTRVDGIQETPQDLDNTREECQSEECKTGENPHQPGCAECESSKSKTADLHHREHAKCESGKSEVAEDQQQRLSEEQNKDVELRHSVSSDQPVDMEST